MTFSTSCSSHAFVATLILTSATLAFAQSEPITSDIPKLAAQSEVVAEQVSLVGCDLPVENPNDLMAADALKKNNCQVLDKQDFENSKFIPSEKPDPNLAPKPGIQWKPLLLQMGLFTGIQHGVRMTEEKTRRQLGGPFLKDWKASVAGLKGWSDGGKFFTNYVAHPMQGATAAFIYKNNDTRYNAITFDLKSRQYWKMAGLAMAFSAAHSVQFEIGPFSEASLGNIGQERLAGYSKMAWVDLVVTPALGTAWMIGEDVIDKRLVRWIEGHSEKKYIYVTARMLLNPIRSFSNLLRFKAPHYRDDRR